MGIQILKYKEDIDFQGIESRFIYLDIFAYCERNNNLEVVLAYVSDFCDEYEIKLLFSLN